MTKIIGIMACTEKGVIGVNNKVPWRIHDEFRHFRRTTYNQTIIMGRKTFQEMLKLNLVKSRNCIIFTRDNIFKSNYKLDGNLKFVSSIQEFQSLDFPDNSTNYMVGGSEIAKLFLKKSLIEEFILTKIHKECSGDVYFPLLLLDGWHRKKIAFHDNYTIYRYTK